jgi:ABC-2 type transport system ATP-binding protein
VGLSPAESKRRVRNYSLGMRQRLGIAHALLGDPSVLILDEPANGLDPAGIHWMRSMLREFAARGGTVLLSSHLLHEVEVLADDMVLIGRGRIVAQGTREELLEASGTIVRGTDRDALWHALSAAGYAAEPVDATAWRVDATTEQVGTVAAKEGIVLTELRDDNGAGLEALFLQLTADTAREHPPLDGRQAVVA